IIWGGGADSGAEGRNPQFQVVLDDLTLPNPEILRKLRENRVAEAIGFYTGLANLVEREVETTPKSEDIESWAGQLKFRKLRSSTSKDVNYHESSAEDTDPKDPSYVDLAGSFTYDEVEEIAAAVIDESETNDVAITFLNMIITAIQLTSRNTMDGTLFQASQRSPTKYNGVKTSLGTYTSWTDGCVVIKKYDQDKQRKHKVTGLGVIADVEVKPSNKATILPQHIAQLNAHMFITATKYKNICQDYEDIPVCDRTCYLLCFNQLEFRVVWVEYKPDWLKALFGPLNKLGDTDGPVKNTNGLDIQEFNVTRRFSLTDPKERVAVARICIFIIFIHLNLDNAK
ncbi:hypothetical protein H0H92_009603, partial [Tricholoma furcatifolium]